MCAAHSVRPNVLLSRNKNIREYQGQVLHDRMILQDLISCFSDPPLAGGIESFYDRIPRAHAGDVLTLGGCTELFTVSIFWFKLNLLNAQTGGPFRLHGELFLIIRF